MGAGHTLTTIANWVLPTGIRIKSCDFIVEDQFATHADTIGGLSQVINNIYAQILPINPVLDYPEASTTTTSPPGAAFARYRVPTLAIADGNQQFDIRAHIYAAVSAGATGTFTFSTPDDSTTVNVTSATKVQVTTSALNVTADGNPKLMQVRGYQDGAGILSCFQIRFEWVPPTSTLLDGPYSPSSFIPIHIAQVSDQERTISVERVRRMLVNLIDLYERRTPHPIVSQSSLNFQTQEAPIVYVIPDSTTVLRAIAKQYAGLREIEVWVEIKWDGTGDPAFVTVTCGDQTLTLGNTLNTDATWFSGTLTMDEWRSPSPREFEFLVDVGNDETDYYGCSAWWREAQY